MRPTPEQERIIEAPCGNILVSAAAGSGKTTVMTERIVSRIVNGETSVDRVLVMTFTNAAAANMSAKLEQKLRERLALESDSDMRRRLGEQLAALPSAYISTIDAFCNKVIASFAASARDEHGELLIEPGSTIIDENHGKIMLREAFDDVFEKGYLLVSKVKEDETFANEVMVEDEEYWPWTIVDQGLTRKEWASQFLDMTEAFGSGRDDTSLKEDMMGKLAYLRSLPQYRQWLQENLRSKKEEMNDPGSTPWAKKVQSLIIELIEERIELIRPLLKDVDEVIFLKDAKKNADRQETMKEWLNYVVETSDAILANKAMTWEEMSALVNRKPTTKITSPIVKETSDETLQNFVANYIPFCELLYCFAGQKLASSQTENFRSHIRFFFGKTMDELKEEARDTYPCIARYFEVVLATDSQYAMKKHAECTMDFPDQEQLALTLLSKEEVAGYYRDLFDEIYIDEYQDNSGVQDAIVQCFAKNNVFFVGDVKQSIYRFRHAKPQLFLDRYAEYSRSESGTLYELKQNFRSVPDVLSVVNEVFDAIMSKEYADIEYNESHQLNPGRSSYEETSGSPVMLIFAEDTWGTDESKNTDEEISENVEKEALIVATQISKLQKLPDFEFRECAVLTTSNEAASKIAGVLMRCGIPAQGPSTHNMLKHPDLRVMIDLARITDNDLQDIPLAGVMKSNIEQASFTDEELLTISLFANAAGKRRMPFCEKVHYYASKAEGELAEKVQAFYAFLHTLRTYAMQMNVAKWLEHVYALTNYTNWVLMQREGEARYYALMALIGWSERFDVSRNTGLRAFVDYMEEMDAQKDANTDIELSASLENVVKCMTIHKSKGLEFPYVFLCGLRNSQNSDHSRILLNERGEMACMRYCPNWQSRYEPHDFFLLKEEESRETDAEKIRLLYVAMTRAEKKLFIVTTFKRKTDDVIESFDSAVIQALKRTPDGKLSRSMMWNLSTHLKKILGGLIRNYHVISDMVCSGGSVEWGDLDYASPVRDTSSTKLAVLAGDGNLLEEHEVTETPLAEEAYECARQSILAGEVETPKYDSEVNVLLRQVRKDADDFEQVHLVPAKSTVSEMKRLLASEENEEEDEGISAEAINLRLRETNEKWKTKGYTATQMGTLIHSVWQYLDFAGLVDSGKEVDWNRELERLSEFGMITSEQIPILQEFAPAMQQFLESDLCEEIAQAEKQTGRGPFREIPFALAVTDFDQRAGTGNAETITSDKHDYTLVQGMIDCWFIDQQDEAVLIDYKSDRLSGSDEEKEQVLRERYWNQLDLYARAITSATGKKVARRIIWLIRDGRSFEF